MAETHLSDPKPLSDRGKLILAAAQKLFLANGFDGTSLEMIINESGGSRRNIYQEFGNKEGLLKAVMQHQVVRQRDTLANINYELPPDQALKEAYLRFAEGLMSDTLIALMRMVVQVVVKLPDVGELIYESGPMSGGKPVEDYLQHLHREGVLVVEDPRAATELLMEMVKGRFHVRRILMPHRVIPEDEIKRHVDYAVDTFLRAHRPVAGAC